MPSHNHLLTSEWSDRRRGGGFRLGEGRCRLDMRKKFFTRGAARPWRRLPGGAGAAPSLAGFKARLDRAGSTLGCGRGPCPWRGVASGWSVRSLPAQSAPSGRDRGTGVCAPGGSPGRRLPASLPPAEVQNPCARPFSRSQRGARKPQGETDGTGNAERTNGRISGGSLAPHSSLGRHRHVRTLRVFILVYRKTTRQSLLAGFSAAHRLFSISRIYSFFFI